MAYISLDCSWREAGEERSVRIGRSSMPGEDYIATEIADILKEHPTATDIKVVERPYNEGYPFAVDALIDCILARRTDLDRMTVERVSSSILRTDRKDYRRGAYIATLPEAKKIFADKSSTYEDWVYFREFGFVLFDVTKHGSHGVFLTHWHRIFELFKSGEEFTFANIRGNFDTGAEQFLHAKHGFYLSSAYGTSVVSKSANMKLTAQEKIVFGKMKFSDIEP